MTAAMERRPPAESQAGGAVRIRVARSSDSPAAGELLRAAYGTDVSDAIFAGSDARSASARHARLFERATGLQSHAHATVAEANAVVVGLVSHTRWGALATGPTAVLYRYVRALGAAAGIAVYFRAHGLARASPPVPDDHYFVPFVAVAPAWWGRGIERALMARAHGAAFAAGAEQCSLYVAIENRTARRFFTRLGYAEMSRAERPKLEHRYGISGRILMSRTIAARDLSASASDTWEQNGGLAAPTA